MTWPTIRGETDRQTDRQTDKQTEKGGEKDGSRMPMYAHETMRTAQEGLCSCPFARRDMSCTLVRHSA